MLGRPGKFVVGIGSKEGSQHETLIRAANSANPIHDGGAYGFYYGIVPEQSEDGSLLFEGRASEPLAFVYTVDVPGPVVVG